MYNLILEDYKKIFNKYPKYIERKNEYYSTIEFMDICEPIEKIIENKLLNNNSNYNFATISVSLYPKEENEYHGSFFNTILLAKYIIRSNEYNQIYYFLDIEFKKLNFLKAEELKILIDTAKDYMINFNMKKEILINNLMMMSVDAFTDLMNYDADSINIKNLYEFLDIAHRRDKWTYIRTLAIKNFFLEDFYNVISKKIDIPKFEIGLQWKKDD